ncbi:DUF3145 domain-containing protein [Rhodococcoides corynebacterioides]|uniref:DUF3145 domain-containing protein n=1 Tax=Rhodococcoides corynebacterioides TaxID=53972 RepID=A0ABS7P4E3_9NOCA|nr:DUF3145 domain-containing protein [Rhodococcus corynebacterioides]MBY6351785.1 DUF3145 domain-containing protein [Rhodococcus corynebacterioides]MBY6364084.1 DUF3145 domain-containing protein [Rhodococcus corynebacterioides]MBY6367289.1 DUF3145 domain-containing protein [Rhodococcus corynebacterioides]MBY6408983.1 DUF3145 domain-containing protein [Rhodococcus corynebacterioides]
MNARNQFADATTGVVWIHSSPAALCPHVEWALSDALDARANLKWTAQPAQSGQLRATTEWVGPVGTGSRLAAVLRSWRMLRFEVTEDPSEGVDGERFAHVPGLGLWHGITAANGDVVVGEQRLKAILAGGGADLAADLDHALGTAWDDELEQFRLGGTGAEVTWLAS